MENGLTPGHLKAILPPKQGHAGRYPVRRSHDYTPLLARTAKYQSSFIPATVRRWNYLDDDIKSKTTLSCFKGALKRKLFKKKKNYYSYGRDKWAVTHTRMRLGLSPLNDELYTYHIVPSPRCPHCNETETSLHFLLECNQYVARRNEMLEAVGPTVVKLGIDITKHHDVNKLLLNGHHDLTLHENIHLFEHVQLFMKNSKRF